MSFGVPPFSGHFGGEGVVSMMGVVGTLGTADTGGTAAVLPVGVNPTTGALFVQDLSGASGTTNIQGSVIITGGTLNAGTFNNAGTFVNIVSGTEQTLGTVGVVNNIVTGTLAAVTTVANLTNGSVNLLTGTVTSVGTNVGMGTLSNVGSVNTVTTVSNVTNGTVRISVGTIASDTIVGGTLQNLISGTFNAGTVVVTAGTVGGAAANAAAAAGNPNPVGGTDSGGTIRTIIVDATGVQRSSGSMVMTVGTINTGTLQNLVTGTINALAAGTITAGTLTNLVSGTINALATGTLTGGTLGNLNYGTIQIDPKPTPIKTLRTTYGTTGTTGAAVFGTLVASVGNGTFVYISGYQVVVTSGTVDCAILDGTFAQTVPSGGTNMITRGQFIPSAGIARDLSIPYVSGTGGTICYWMGGAGTAYFQIDYWTST